MVKKMRKIFRNTPNIITCLNLLAGCVACIFSFKINETFGALTGYQMVFIMIGIAAVFDFCDGASARLLHAYSNMGKELDSLSDLISFGLAPALLMFNTMNQFNSESIISYFALYIAIMGALRLAKFNVDDSQATTFRGLPIPANALFWIGMCSWINVHGYPGDIAMCIIIFFVASLMISRMEMLSLKFSNFNFRENFRRYAIIIAAILFVVVNGIEGFMWTIAFYVVISRMKVRIAE